MRFRQMSYEEWLINNSVIEAEELADEPAMCPECFLGEPDEECSICHGEGRVPISRAAYDEQLRKDAKAIAAYCSSLGLKRCPTCGDWVKVLYRMRWFKVDKCMNCFERTAAELRLDYIEHNYDRHFIWGQGL